MGIARVVSRVILIALTLIGFASAAYASQGSEFLGTWEGHYYCAQGRTLVTLEIWRDPDDTLAGTFSFRPPPGGRGEVGAYEFELRFRGDEIRLVPTRWIQRPYRWQMVPANVRFDGRDRMRGRIASPSCGEIDVTRVSGDDKVYADAPSQQRSNRRDSPAPRADRAPPPPASTQQQATSGSGETTPTAEQVALIRRNNCTLTRVVATPIYHADGHYINGHVNMCSEQRPWLDVSVGSAAPKAGEVFVFVYGRFVLGQKYNQHQSIMFQRGQPNTFYPVKGDVKEAMYTSGTLPNGTYTWKNAKKILPFMPTAVHDQGVLPGTGRHWYAYSGSRPLPGRAADMRPLDEDSVIIAIDGISFNAPRAFSAALEYPAPGQEWVEVIYFQKNDENGPIRRAYLPLLPKHVAAADWDRMVDANPIFQPNYMRAAIVIVALGKIIYDVANSPFGQQMQRDYEECLKRQATSLGPIIC